MYYFEQTLYEQDEYNENQLDAEQLGDEQDYPSEENEIDPEAEYSASLEPIKKYHLTQKLFNLNDKLNQLRIKNDVLAVVLNFIDSFSYPTLLKITNKLIEEITLQVQTELKNNK